MTSKYFWLFYYYYDYYLLYRSFGTSGYWCHFFSYSITKPVPFILYVSPFYLSCLLMSFHLARYYFLYPPLFLHPLSTYPRIHPYIILPSSSALCLCLFLFHDLSHSMYPFISISHSNQKFIFLLSFFHFYSFVFLSNRESSGSTWFWGSDGWRTVRENFDFFNNILQNFLL